MRAKRCRNHLADCPPGCTVQMFPTFHMFTALKTRVSLRISNRYTRKIFKSVITTKFPDIRTEYNKLSSEKIIYQVYHGLSLERKKEKYSSFIEWPNYFSVSKLYLNLHCFFFLGKLGKAIVSQTRQKIQQHVSWKHNITLLQSQDHCIRLLKTIQAMLK